MNQDKATCNICGMEMPATTEEVMLQHLIFYHPMELLQVPKIQKGIFALAESFGGKLADFFKGGK